MWCHIVVSCSVGAMGGSTSWDSPQRTYTPHPNNSAVFAMYRSLTCPRHHSTQVMRSRTFTIFLISSISIPFNVLIYWQWPFPPRVLCTHGAKAKEADWDVVKHVKAGSCPYSLSLSLPPSLLLPSLHNIFSQIPSFPLLFLSHASPMSPLWLVVTIVHIFSHSLLSCRQ
jgi:hypothetical protein